MRGWNFLDENNDATDLNGHGTHVAGTIGALGNNGLGVIGVSPVVRILPLKIGNYSIETAAAISAVQYAASFKDASGNNLVRLSNNSWGGGNKSKALENAIKNSGALFCAAAGNGGSSSFHYPAAYKLPNVIAVAATDHNDEKAGWSNYGSWVHLAAPGVNVFSTIPNEGYRFASGTSMATPHVVGALALLRAEFPSWDNAALKNQLLATVDTLPSLSGLVASGGRLNAANALGAPPAPADAIPSAAVTDLAAAAPSQTSVILSWTATGDDGLAGTAYLYDLRLSTTPITADNWSSATPVADEPLPQSAGATETLSVNNLSPGTTFYFALKVFDEAGNASELSNQAIGTTVPLDWDVEIVDADTDSRLVGRYSSLAFHRTTGQAAVVYDDSIGQIHFATRTASGWTSESLAPAQGGVSLAYDSSGTPTATWIAQGKMGKGGVPTQTLYFGARTGSTWSKTAVQANLQLGPEITSLAYGPGRMPAISFDQYNNTRGLRFAWRDVATWKTQVVDVNCHPRYNSLAFAPNGNPAIAYSRVVDDDGLLDTVMFAEGVWNGSAYTWTISMADTAPIGGVFVALSFDSLGNPVITHRTDSLDFTQPQVTLVRRVGGVWLKEVVADGNLSFSTADPINDQVHVAYSASGALNVASAPLYGPDEWSYSIADSPTSLFWPGSIRVAPDGLPAASYRTGGLRFAKKNP